ncbi:MAG: NmrA/HSCARG family protein [Bacteroidetes bacterium]|nr:NmrA/HSCARG family protein [Bacteroidota bacterium]
MAQKKLIAIVGATGAQGGGLARAILNDGNSEFSVRAITRNPESENAKTLLQMGAEVVKADIDNVESITEAFKGAYGAYCVTNFWEHFSPEKEVRQVKNMALAAKAAELHHVIWSTLEDTRIWVPLSSNAMPTLMNNYKVPHFDAKGESNKFFAEQGVPTTNLLTSFYWENLIYFQMGPQKGEEGKYNFNLPMGDKKLPGISVEDIGKCAYGVFKAGGEYIGKTIGITGEHLTGLEMAAKQSSILNKDIKYNHIPFDVYRSFDFPGAADLGNMFQFKHDYEDYFCGIRDIDLSKKLNPELLDFNSWLVKNKEKIQLD